MEDLTITLTPSECIAVARALLFAQMGGYDLRCDKDAALGIRDRIRDHFLHRNVEQDEWLVRQEFDTED